MDSNWRHDMLALQSDDVKQALQMWQGNPKIMDHVMKKLKCDEWDVVMNMSIIMKYMDDAPVCHVA